jgi:hypothetical protein
MVPGHPEWGKADTTSPGALYSELTGRTDFRREKLFNRLDLLAQNSEPGTQYYQYFSVDQNQVILLPRVEFTGEAVYIGAFPVAGGGVVERWLENGKIHDYPVEWGDEITVIAKRDDPTPRLPPTPPPPPSSAFTPTPTESAVPGARSGAASGLYEWLYKDSLGIIYNGGSNDAFKQNLPVDTGSILGNYAINTWLSLSNVVAGYLNAGSVITNTVDDFFNRHLGYGAIQTMLPMSKAMGIAVEAGPASVYLAARLSTWWSKFSTSPRVLSAALAPIFPTLGAGGTSSVAAQSSTSAANLEHVLAGGSGDRGIAVFHIDTSRLTPTELETAIVHVRDIDYQAGIADGLARIAVPSRSNVTNSVAALGRKALSLNNVEIAGHSPDVAGGGSPLGPITGLPTYVNSAIAGQWGRYAPGFTFDGFSMIDRATGQFLYISLALEHEPALITNFR